MSLRSRFLLKGQALVERGAWFLAPLSWVWGFVSFCKNKLYDWRCLPVVRVNRPVVSIGNLVAGGTGKTPLVHLLATRFAHRNVAILSRAYGEFHDEPYLLQRRLPKAKVYIGKDRAKLARQAVQDGAQLLILDDGFQYRKLRRDFDCVVLSGADPFGKGHFLPKGYLRDSPDRLKEADAIFVTGRSFPLALPSISLQVRVDRILDFDQNLVPSIRGLPVAMFCGIAKPGAFKKTLADLGAKLVAEWILADHERPNDERLKAFARYSKSLGAKALLCTEKDFVKLRLGPRQALPLLYVEISLEVAEGAERWENLIAKIDQKIDNISSY